MNILDIVIIAIFAFFVLLGWFEGFFRSVLGVASFFLSWLGAMIFYPVISTDFHMNQGLVRVFLENVFNTKQSIVDMMLYYNEGFEIVNDSSIANMSISQLTNTQLTQIVNNANLPSPIGKLVEQNIATQAFASKDITTVGDYFNHTIINFSINVVSFLIVFCIITLIITLLIHWYDYTFHLPVLRHFDSAIGLGFGSIRAFFMVFVLFMLIPLVLVVLGRYFPLMQILESSFFGSFFYKSNFLLNMISGT